MKSDNVWDGVWRNDLSEYEFIKGLSRERLLSYFKIARLLDRVEMKSSLEIGCGSGIYSFVMKELNIVDNICLLDSSYEAIRLANRIASTHNIECITILGDARKLPIKDESFDISFSGGLLEHFPVDEQVQIIREHLRVAPLSIIQVPVHSPAYWIMRVAVMLKYGGWRFGFERPLTKPTIFSLVRRAGGKMLGMYSHDLHSALEFKTGLHLPGSGLAVHECIFMIGRNGKDDLVRRNKGHTNLKQKRKPFDRIFDICSYCGRRDFLSVIHYDWFSIRVCHECNKERRADNDVAKQRRKL